MAADKAAANVTTPGKLTFEPVDGVVVSAEERAKNLEAARIAQEAVAKRQAEEKAAAEQAGLVALANQQAADKAAADKAAADAAEWEYNSNKAREETAAWEARQKVAAEQAGLVAIANQQAAEKAAVANTLFQQGNITAMPTGVAATGSNVFEKPPSTGGVNETVSLPTNTVVQSVNPSNGGPTSASVGPITAAQRDLGPLNISNLGAVISPQAMNSTAGGVASLVSPQVTVQPQTQPAVTQLPKYNAPAQTVINAGTTQVLDSSGTPIPGRRRLGFA